LRIDYQLLMNQILLSRVAVLLLTVAVLTQFTGCRPAESTDAGPVIATTVAPHAWLVQRIAGDDATVLVALSGIASCHDHAPPESSVVALSRADLYLRAGIGAENGPWLEAVTAAGGMPVVDLLAAARTGLTEDLAATIGADAHAWTSPAALRRQAAAITDALAERWPERAETFRTNAAALDADLTQLEAAVDRTLAEARGRTIVVDHAAWGWLAAEHGIRQVAVIPEPGSASDQSLESIRSMMEIERLRTIIVQPQHDSRASRALAESIGGTLVSIDPMAADPAASIAAAAEAIVAASAPAPTSASVPGPGPAGAGA
jgi:zinc transport system substrate-binding protein